MSVRAGSILHVGGQNVIDRIQSAGLGDTRLPMETIREVGNREVVDKVPGEPDFTFTMESLDTSVELEALLTGGIGASGAENAGAGAADAAGTEYDWIDCVPINIPSPWKDPDSGSAGTVEAGHLIPGYYPTRITYRFGVTDNATQTVELGGGSYYYGRFAPIEQFETGDGVEDEFVTDQVAVHQRKGGSGGTDFRSIFGVIVDGVLMSEDVDYTVAGGAAAPGSVATITFNDPPANNADIRFCYFTSAAVAYPQAVHASLVTKPGAVRGRNIHVYVDPSPGGADSKVKVGGIQTAELEATVDSEVERELGTEEITGRTINGTDCRGTLTVRPKSADSFLDLMATVLDLDTEAEVIGWFNENTVELQIRIENPKAPGTYLKTLLVEDAKFQPPGTPARVNTATDFALQFESVTGTYKAVKGLPV